MPPIDQPSSARHGCLGHRVGGHDRSRGAGPTVGPDLAPGCGIAAVILSIGSRTPISPVEQTATSTAPMPSGRLQRTRPLGGAVGVGEAVRAGARVGAAGVQDHGLQRARRAAPARPQHRRRLDPVAGEDARRPRMRAVVDAPGPDRLAAGLETGSDPAGEEALGVVTLTAPAPRSSMVWPAAPASPRGGLRCRHEDPVGVEGRLGHHRDVGLGQRSEQPGEHADQRVVQRSVDAERENGPSGDVPARRRSADHRQLVGGPGDAPERRLVSSS